MFHMYSNFNRILCKETVETSIRLRILRHLVWVCTIYLRPTRRLLGLYGLIERLVPFFSPVRLQQQRVAILCVLVLSLALGVAETPHFVILSAKWLRILSGDITWVKVFRIIPEFRILRLTFHRKSASKCWILQIVIAFLI